MRPNRTSMWSARGWRGRFFVTEVLRLFLQAVPPPHKYHLPQRCTTLVAPPPDLCRASGQDVMAEVVANSLQLVSATHGMRQVPTQSTVPCHMPTAKFGCRLGRLPGCGVGSR